MSKPHQLIQRDVSSQKKSKKAGFLVGDNSDDESSVRTTSTVQTWSKEKEYEVKQVLAERIGLNEHDEEVEQLLIEWKDYPMSECTWEPRNDQMDSVITGWRLKQQKIAKGFAEEFDWRKWQRDERNKKDRKCTKRAIKRWIQGLPLSSVAYVKDEKPHLFKESDRPEPTGPLGVAVVKKGIARQVSWPKSSSPDTESDSSDDDSDVPLADSRRQSNSRPDQTHSRKQSSSMFGKVQALAGKSVTKKADTGKNDVPTATGRNANKAINKNTTTAKATRAPATSSAGIKSDQAKLNTNKKDTVGKAVPAANSSSKEQSYKSVDESASNDAHKASLSRSSTFGGSTPTSRISSDVSVARASTLPNHPQIKLAKRTASNPLIQNKRKVGFTISQSPTDQETVKKRKTADPSTINTSYKNLRHAHNVNKKEREKADAIPDVARLNLVQPGNRGVVASSAMDISSPQQVISAPSRPRIETDMSVYGARRETIRVPSASTAPLLPVDQTPIHSYEQHNKAPGSVPLTCPYWAAQKECPRKTGCFFKHSQMDKDAKLALFEQCEKESISRGPFELKFGFFRPAEVCRFWARNGVCNQDDVACWHAHWHSINAPTSLTPSLMPGLAPRNTLKKTCPFWAAGKCNRIEAACQFAHEYTGVIAFRPGPGAFGSERETTSVNGVMYIQTPNGFVAADQSSLSIASPNGIRSPHNIQPSFPGSIMHPNRQVMLPQAVEPIQSDRQAVSFPQSMAPVIHPDRQTMLSLEGVLPQVQIAKESINTNQPLSASLNTPITSKMKLRLLVNEIHASWTLPLRFEQPFRQAGGTCVVDHAITSTQLQKISLGEAIPSGSFSNLEGDSASVARFRDLAFWLSTQEKAVWHALPNSSFGILIVPAKKKIWSTLLPDIQDKVEVPVWKGPALVYYILAKTQVSGATESIPAALANMDTDMGKINTHINEIMGKAGPEGFFECYGGIPLDRNVYIGNETTSRFSLLMELYFQAAGANVLRDWATFHKKTTITNRAGIIILNADEPLEKIKMLDQFADCLFSKCNIFRFSIGAMSGSIQCQRLAASGSVIHITTEALVDDSDQSVAILKRYDKQKVARGQTRSWKLYLPGTFMTTISECLDRLTKLAEQNPSRDVSHVLSDLVGVLTPIDKINKLKPEDPLILSPENQRPNSDTSGEGTLEEFIKWTMREGMTKSRRMYAILSQAQFEKFSQIRDVNQHIRFYTPETFTSQMVKLLV